MQKSTQELDELFHAKPFIDIKYAAGRKLKMKGKSPNSPMSPADDEDDGDDKEGLRNSNCSE